VTVRFAGRPSESWSPPSARARTSILARTRCPPSRRQWVWRPR
jgi:hypothetical protein